MFSCSVNNVDNTSNNQITITQWNLINTSGGFAGVNDNFEIGDIIWVFNELTGSLTVINKNTDDMLQDGLDSGNYSYIFSENDSNLFLTVNDSIEFGLLTISEDTETFTLNQNVTLAGIAADGFIYTFEKMVIIID
ncbi:hypothetical protein GCM10023311_22820 [Flaviramulus aquimarinus]|uniref:Lipocalin-like domain-containing protein n=1 Tax=Flaviramulus aquimarinus TaxID=1170456 RepID=A0ABP9FGW3_9FLAO